MKKVILFFLLYQLILQDAGAQNIGIGTTSPQSKLDINGDIALRSADLTISTTYTYTLKLNTVKRSYYKFKPATVPERIQGICGNNIGVSTTARTSIINP